jgi:hypothetical protein
MRYIQAFIIGLVLAGFVAPYYTHTTAAQETEDKDHAKYRQVKDAIKTVLVHVAKKYGGETYDEGKLAGFISEANKILATVQKEYPNIAYSVAGDKDINTPKVLEKGFMFISTIIEYKDEVGTILWEFPTVFGVNEVSFFSVQLDGTPKNFEDYYRWEHMKKGPTEDKENKTEQGL